MGCNLLWEQEVGGSNPLTPIDIIREIGFPGSFFLLAKSGERPHSGCQSGEKLAKDLKGETPYIFCYARRGRCFRLLEMEGPHGTMDGRSRKAKPGWANKLNRVLQSQNTTEKAGTRPKDTGLPMPTH